MSLLPSNPEQNLIRNQTTVLGAQLVRYAALVENVFPILAQATIQHQGVDVCR